MAARAISFQLNGRAVHLETRPQDLLLEVLRDRFGLMAPDGAGRKGQVGASTVLVDGMPTLSCLTLALTVDGRRVTTVEGLDQRDDAAGFLRESFFRIGAGCSHCMPGAIMSAAALLLATPRPGHDDIERGMSGNACTCPGHAHVAEAVLDAVKRHDASVS